MHPPNWHTSSAQPAEGFINELIFMGYVSAPTKTSYSYVRSRGFFASHEDTYAPEYYTETTCFYTKSYVNV